MKTKEKSKLNPIVAVLIFSMAALQSVSADSLHLTPKSKTIATILAFDPIPGDALLYAGKPIQGVTNLVVGGFGGVIFFSAMNSLSENADCEGDMCGLSRGYASIAMAFGAVLYFPMLLWDGIGGMSGVAAHNKKVRKQSTWIPSPSVDYVPNQGGNVQVSWKF